MNVKLFSKRHPEILTEVQLKPHVRQRIWYLIEDMDLYLQEQQRPYFSSNEEIWNPSHDGIHEKLTREYGLKDLRIKVPEGWRAVGVEQYLLNSEGYHFFDAIEYFCDWLRPDKMGYSSPDKENVYLFQQKLNTIFEEDNLTWRMMDGRIVKLDSQWVETEIRKKVYDLLASHRFEGPLQEFLEARSSLTSGDSKEAIRQSSLALESTMKGILEVDMGKPDELIRKIIATRMIPEYAKGFLTALREHILKSPITIRNNEKGAGHGQGVEVNDTPLCLAELAVNLSGVLILYLMKKYIDIKPGNPQPPEDLDLDLDDDEDFFVD